MKTYIMHEGEVYRVEIKLGGIDFVRIIQHRRAAEHSQGSFGAFGRIELPDGNAADWQKRSVRAKPYEKANRPRR